jgi:hypothetical protein
MTLINRFEGSCGTFEKEKNPIVINNIGSICPKKTTNDHGVDVNMIIVI